MSILSRLGNLARGLAKTSGQDDDAVAQAALDRELETVRPGPAAAAELAARKAGDDFPAPARPPARDDPDPDNPPDNALGDPPERDEDGNVKRTL